MCIRDRAKGILIATQEDLDEHTGNKAIHVTEDERAAWNAKADAAALSAKADASSFNVHKDDAVVHITAKERETWNGKQDKLTDEAGNMTLDGGLTAQGGTFSDAVNANGGINIPLAAGAVTNTAVSYTHLVFQTIGFLPPPGWCHQEWPSL